MIKEAINKISVYTSGRFDRGIWMITLVELITAAGFSTCIPFLSLYLYQERGVPMTVVGLVFLINGLLSAGTQMAGGILSDRFGRKKLMMSAMAVNILCYTGMAFLIAMDAEVWIILTVHVLGRSAGMTARPAFSAMIVDLSKEGHLTETFGLLRVGRNVGWAAGPALGGFLATFLPYSWLFGTAVIMNALSLCIITVFLKESWSNTAESTETHGFLSVISNRSFVMFTSFCLLVFLSMAHFGTTLSVFTVDRIGFTTAEYGLLLTINGLLVVFLQYPVALGISKIRKARALVMGGILYGIGYLVMSATNAYYIAAIAMFIITMGEITFSPVATAVAGELAPEQQRGRYMGFFGWSETIGMSFAPLIGGLFLDTFTTNPGCVWFPIAGFSFLAAAGFLWWGRKK
ncbi:MAG: MFS transporter [Dehalococcoidales bacterium]|nr:MFS transporter [Dehalococcoidales bacterium]